MDDQFLFELLSTLCTKLILLMAAGSVPLSLPYGIGKVGRTGFLSLLLDVGLVFPKKIQECYIKL